MRLPVRPRCRRRVDSPKVPYPRGGEPVQAGALVEPRATLNELLGISAHRAERSVTVAARGELDISTSPPLREAIDRQLSVGDEVEGVVLDLAGLTFCDSAGLALIIHAARVARAENVPFAIVPPRCADANRVFEVSGTNDVLPFDAVEAEDEPLGTRSSLDGPAPHAGSRA